MFGKHYYYLVLLLYINFFSLQLEYIAGGFALEKEEQILGK